MKISFKHDSIQRKNSDVCVVTEHPIGDDMIDFAIVTVTGKYPNTKQATNLVCKEIVYIQEGSGKVTVNGKEHALSTGDVVLIEAGEKFIWEGQMRLFISCTPAFTIDQHQLVD